MKNLVEQRDEWIWPKDDHGCWKYMNKWKSIPHLISSHVENKNTLVQAGGNCGFYIKPYAEIFNSVYTFEPNPLNFYCLSNNITNENVFKFQACLGKNNKPVSMKFTYNNVGKHHVVGEGNIPSLTIDSLGLTSCNLIHLDIEGYELYALKGGRQTILKYKPLIAIEFYEQHAARYQYNLEEIESFIFSLGYEFLTQYDTDRMYQFKK
jgi:FkbM family methyltransferase